MKKLLLTITAFLAFVSVAYADGTPDEECTDARCIAVHNPIALRPPVADLVCIYFVQPSPQIVVVSLKLKNGETRMYSRPKAAKDSFCIGRSWVKQSVLINLCNNTTGSADYFGNDLAALAVKQKEAATLEACLSGRAECAKMGYKVVP